MLLVVGQPEIFDLAHEYRFPEASRHRLRYCGYIHHKKSTHRHINRKNSPNQFSVLVAAGGGGDGFPLIQTYLEGLQRQLSGLQLHSTVITGPEMPADQQAQLREQATGIPNLELLEFSPQMEEQLAGADLVICMGGYNTLCETVVNRKRTIVIPRTQPVEEQWIRAKHFANRGLLEAIHPDNLSPETLMQTIDRNLTHLSDDGLPDVLDFNGLERMHYWVNQLLEKQQTETLKEETLSCMHY
ncbi:MAG: glycosyltransferase [Thiolinea sp.]